MGARVEAPPGRRFGVGDPPAGDDHELLGVAGTELVAPGLVGDLAQQVGGGAQRPGGRRCPRAPRRRWPPARCPAAARARSAAQSGRGRLQRQGVEHRPRRRTATARRRRARPPRSASPRSSRPAGRARRRSPPARRDAERAEPAALVRQDWRPVHLEPARRAAAEAQGPAVVAGTEEDDLGRCRGRGRGRPRRRSPACVAPAPTAAPDGDAHASRRCHGRGGAPPRRRRRASRGACAPGGVAGPRPSGP